MVPRHGVWYHVYIAMKILFVSNELIAGNISRVLTQEGHEVKLFIREKKLKNCFDGMVEKTDSWEDEIPWVGKDGLIIFDDTGYGKKQDALRKQGYTVFGGSYLGERLELDRSFAQELFKKSGLQTLSTYDFHSFEDALTFVEKNKRAWVVKCDGHDFKHFIFLGGERDGSDIRHILKTYTHLEGRKPKTVTLQERIWGVEIGIGRYFNGKTWVGPIEYNIEHPHLFSDRVGPVTSEMGTLAWYGKNERETLFSRVLAPLKDFLHKADFRGDFSINCIVNKKGIFPLEATARFGSPIVHLQTALHKSPWGEFLYAVAKGHDYSLSYKKGYGVVLLGALPPFPYVNTKGKSGAFTKNTPVMIPKNISSQEKKHIHFEGVALRNPSNPSSLYVATEYGYCLYTTGVSSRVSMARKKALSLMKKIRVHKMFYRSDIGKDFEEKDRSLLERYHIATPKT
jgi:phosphoribosylamine--glycine ligase